MTQPTNSKIISLQESSNILHLLAHRNKNQHRRSQWWKHFNLLRRNLAHLLTEYSVSSTHQNGPASINARARIKARESHMAMNILPKCHPAFRTLATEGRFCALGLVLMGVLADISRHIRPLTPAPEPRMEPKGAEKDVEIEATKLKVLQTEDLGVRIERDLIDRVVGEKTMPGALVEADLDFALDAATNAIAAPASIKSDSAGQKSRKDVKKKRKNAIDDLFSGLT